LSQAQKIIELRDIEIEKIESKIEQLETENAEYRNSLATQTNDLQLALNERDRIESLFADKSIRRFAALTNAAKAYAQAARDAQLASNQQALQA
jgi:DNA gyrase/topoisomerase IV subunit A